jgi:hypothetical protein
MRAVTIDELDQAAGGMLPLILAGAFAFGYCMGVMGAALYSIEYP